jgi:hypothetical protein
MHDSDISRFDRLLPLLSVLTDLIDESDVKSTQIACQSVRDIVRREFPHTVTAILQSNLINTLTSKLSSSKVLVAQEALATLAHIAHASEESQIPSFANVISEIGRGRIFEPEGNKRTAQAARLCVETICSLASAQFLQDTVTSNRLLIVKMFTPPFVSLSNGVESVSNGFENAILALIYITSKSTKKEVGFLLGHHIYSKIFSAIDDIQLWNDPEEVLLFAVGALSHILNTFSGGMEAIQEKERRERSFSAEQGWGALARAVNSIDPGNDLRDDVNSLLQRAGELGLLRVESGESGESGV